MGTGKSTVGRLLAERTGRRFIDTDDLIIQESGLAIDEMFQQEGEAVFRAWERTISRRLSGKSDLVIASGGGLMIDPVNATLLGQNNLVYCLAASPADILDRLASDRSIRPLLSESDPEDRIAGLLAERAEGYSQFVQVNAGGRPAEIVAEEIASFTEQATARPFTSRFQVQYPTGRYPVFVGYGLLERLGSLVMLQGPVAVISDENVAKFHGQKLELLRPQVVITVEAGESNKNLDTIRQIYDQLLAGGIDRQSTIIALGGGVIGDMAGFAAATYMRGIEYISCPTTVLSMVDASVGGKTGVDLPQGKNLVGAFKQPIAVLADLETLDSLPAAEFSAGLAEVVKHGLLGAPALLDQLEKAGASKRPVKEEIKELQALIVEAILVKRDVVEADPFELGHRKVLNLGHTFAHAFEQVSEYRISHGRAVAIGLVAALNLSATLGFTRPSLQGRIEGILTGLNLPTRIPGELQAMEIIRLMGSDKKKAAGRLQFVLLKGIGQPFVSDEVPEAAVDATLHSLGAL